MAGLVLVFTASRVWPCSNRWDQRYSFTCRRCSNMWQPIRYGAVLLLAFLLTGRLLAAEPEFIAKGAIWRYLDNGSDQGTAWQVNTFDDSSWQSGAAQLGYGDGDETTVVGYGSSSSSKYITTYFRFQFHVQDASQYQKLQLDLLRDDGVVVYLNGSEVLRDNMPSGAITYQTLSSSTIAGSDESLFTRHELSSADLITGTNTLAVEVHQRDGISSDISLDLALTGVTGNRLANVIRGPYLQLATSNSMTIRWRTDVATDSQVQVGTSVDNLAMVVDSASQTTEHELSVTGLDPATTYYYAIGSSGLTLLSGSDYRFRTSPATGSRVPTRLWVIGDSGTANRNAQAVYDAYRHVTGAAHTDLWLMLGDNAYLNGTDDEYQSAVFDLYPELLRQTPLWPTLGNHDGYSADSASESGPYYDIFTLPRQAEAGGLTSGTEAYYSFDYANMHFIVLDSYETSRTSDDAMMQWLEADLQNTTADWIIAFWHHPPYSKGSHDSDTDSRMTDMRAIALPILESYGVDLVLTGHSHAYERSKLIGGHYQSSDTFSSAYEIDAGSGRADDTGIYQKRSDSAYSGAVYVVAGSSGQVSPSGNLNHPAMYLSLRELGSMILEVDGLTLNASFIDDKGAQQDYFTLDKQDVPNHDNGTLTRSAGCGLIASSGRGYRQITSSGKTRQYYLSVPANYDPDKAYNLVFGMHGLNNDGIRMRDYLRLEDTAPAADTLFVYPDALQRQWPEFGNNTYTGWLLKHEDNEDFVLFDDILAELENNYCINSTRVYVTGQGSGGDVTSSLACARGNRIAAATGVAINGDFFFTGVNGYEETYPTLTYMDCQRSVPMITYRGANDVYQAGKSSDWWYGVNQCNSPAGNASKESIPSNGRYEDSGCIAPNIYVRYSNISPYMAGDDHQIPQNFESETMSFFLSHALPAADSDGDGVADDQDAFPNDPDESVDTDGDGLGNNSDTDDDDDGMPDIWEITNGLDPLNADDATQDKDGDGATNLEEYQLGGDPNDAADGNGPAVKIFPALLELL